MLRMVDWTFVQTCHNRINGMRLRRASRMSNDDRLLLISRSSNNIFTVSHQDELQAAPIKFVFFSRGRKGSPSSGHHHHAFHAMTAS